MTSWITNRTLIKQVDLLCVWVTEYYKPDAKIIREKGFGFQITKGSQIFDEIGYHTYEEAKAEALKKSERFVTKK